jgi:hypothetical protein
MAGIDKTYVKNWNEYLEIQEWCKSVGTVIDVYGNTFKPIDYLWEYTVEEFQKNIDYQIELLLDRYNNGQMMYQLEEGYLTKEEYDNITNEPMKHIGGLCIWNTPVFFDLWLIRNCPLDIIKERLEEQYGKDSCEEIRNHKSYYDTFQRNGLGKNITAPLSNKHCRLSYKHSSDRYENGKKMRWTDIDIELPGIKVNIDTDREFTDTCTMYSDDIDKWLYYTEKCIYRTYSSSSMFSVNGFMSQKSIYRKLQKWNLPKGTQVRITYNWEYEDEPYTYYKEKKLIIKKKK